MAQNIHTHSVTTAASPTPAQSNIQSSTSSGLDKDPGGLGINYNNNNNSHLGNGSISGNRGYNISNNSQGSYRDQQHQQQIEREMIIKQEMIKENIDAANRGNPISNNPSLNKVHTNSNSPNIPPNAHGAVSAATHGSHGQALQPSSKQQHAANLGHNAVTASANLSNSSNSAVTFNKNGALHNLQLDGQNQNLNQNLNQNSNSNSTNPREQKLAHMNNNYAAPQNTNSIQDPNAHPNAPPSHSVPPGHSGMAPSQNGPLPNAKIDPRDPTYQNYPNHTSQKQNNHMPAQNNNTLTQNNMNSNQNQIHSNNNNISNKRISPINQHSSYSNGQTQHQNHNDTDKSSTPTKNFQQASTTALPPGNEENADNSESTTGLPNGQLPVSERSDTSQASGNNTGQKESSTHGHSNNQKSDKRLSTSVDSNLNGAPGLEAPASINPQPHPVNTASEPGTQSSGQPQTTTTIPTEAEHNRNPNQTVTNSSTTATTSPAKDENINIISVYRQNLHQEFQKIRQTVKTHKNIALDTEFPGVCLAPGAYIQPRDIKSEKYNQIKANVDCLNMIQLGLCFLDDNGNLAPECSVWQFHFQFNISHSSGGDMYNEDSIQMLKDAGIDFDRLSKDGIPRYAFAELFTTSGLCLNPRVSWITYHSAYDILYMMKIFRDDHFLPEDCDQLMKLVKLIFPNLYDIKFICKQAGIQEAGLANVAEQYGVTRKGDAHQAGSDSLLTGQTFFKLKETIKIDLNPYKDVIFGIGEGISDTERLRHDKMKNNYRNLYSSNYDTVNYHVANMTEQASQNSTNQRLFTRMPTNTSHNTGPVVFRPNPNALTPTPPPGSDKSLDKNNNSLVSNGKMDGDKKRNENVNLVNAQSKS